jgi:hypothetical protein
MGAGSHVAIENERRERERERKRERSPPVVPMRQVGAIHHSLNRNQTIYIHYATTSTACLE